MGQVSQDRASATDAATFFAGQAAMYTDATAVMADLRAGAKDFVLLDTRPEGKFVSAHLPGAQHLPPEAIDEATAAHFLPDAKRLVVCYDDGNGITASRAAARLALLDYSVKVLLGGVADWRAADYRLEGVNG